MRVVALRDCVGVVDAHERGAFACTDEQFDERELRARVRGRALVLGTRWLWKTIEGEMSAQSQAVCAASHSRSRMKR